MSLINDMLRDLDRRGVFARGPAPELGSMTVPRARARLGIAWSRRWPYAALVGVLIVLLGALGWLGQRPASPDSDASPLAAPHTEVPVARTQSLPWTRSGEAQRPLAAALDPPAPPARDPKPRATPAHPSSPSIMLADPPASAEQATGPVPAPSERPPPGPSPATPGFATAALPAPAPSAAHAAADVPVASTSPHLRIERQDAGAAVAEDSERWAAQRLQAAAAALAAARPGEAEQLLRAVLQRQPQRLRARQSLASLYLLQGRRETAVTLLEEGLRLDPQSPALAQLLGRVHLEAAEPDRATAVLAQAPPALADDPAYHALLAAAWQQAGRPDRAAEVYQALLRQDGSVGAWWLGLGLAQEALGEEPQALQAFARARASSDLEAGVLRYLEQRIHALEAGTQ